jgi:hypothetical protein
VTESGGEVGHGGGGKSSLCTSTTNLLKLARAHCETFHPCASLLVATARTVLVLRTSSSWGDSLLDSVTPDTLTLTRGIATEASRATLVRSSAHSVDKNTTTAGFR